LKPTVMDDIARSGNLGGVQHAMKLDEHGLAHIMSLLTDLYSDPLMAIIREYSTNALDSHIEAGVTRPIEISTPTGLAPMFVVRDYGIGMSADDIRDIYSKYGASTKRGTDDQVGMLGLGCKSGLTYTPQFTLTGVKDGIMTFVSISRNNDGTGVMEVIDSRPTNEPNGVVVAIPVKSQDFQLLNSKVRHFFRFWKPGAALVDGKDPSNLGDMKVGGNFYIVDGLSQDMVVMGNVAYPLESRIHVSGRYNRNDFGVVAFVDIGDVHFVPSREALHYTKKTNETLGRLRREFADALLPAVESVIAKCETHADAVKAYIEWTQRLDIRSATLQYKGLAIQTYYKGDGWVYFPDGRRSAIQPFRGLEHRYIEKTVVVTGFDAEKVTSTTRAKLRFWSQQNNFYPHSFTLVKDMFGAPWTDTIRQVTFDDIKALKIPRNPNPAVKKEAEYDTFDRSRQWFSDKTPASKIDQTKPIYYIARSEKPLRWTTLTPNLGDATIVELNKNRWEKFVRDFPTAKHLRVFIEESLNKAKDALTEDDKMCMEMPWYLKNLLSKMDSSKVLDPQIKMLIDTSSDSTKVHSVTLKNYQTWVKIAQEFNMSYPSNRVRNVLTHYPLVKDGMDGPYNDHFYLYVNAVYTARNV
jgi:hypothetical protein